MAQLILGIFASGNGSNARAIHRAIQEKKLDARMGVVISNNPDAGVLKWAEEAAIPNAVIAREHHPERLVFVRSLTEMLSKHRVTMVILAGYMKKLPPEVIRVYPNRVLNIHPALLPAFGGKGLFGHRVHEAVIKYGAKITGVTVHLVDEAYDEGPVVLQVPVPVADEDTAETLAQRVLAVEHDTYYKAIRLFSENRITINDRKVIVHT